MVKRGHFEVLRKKTSNMPREVWAEESKNGLGFEIGASYDDVQTRSQLVQWTATTCPPWGGNFYPRLAHGGGATQKFQAWVFHFHWTRGDERCAAPS